MSTRSDTIEADGNKRRRLEERKRSIVDVLRFVLDAEDWHPKERVSNDEGWDAECIEELFLERILQRDASGHEEVERASPVEYLHGCWIRAREERKRIETEDVGREADSTGRILEAIREVEYLVPRFTGSSMVSPSAFRARSDEEDLVTMCVRGKVNDPSFVEALYTELEECGGAEESLGSTFRGLHAAMKEMYVSEGNYSPRIATLRLLITGKSLPYLVHGPLFLPRAGATLREIETDTFLGPLFRFSSCSSSDPRSPDAFASSTSDFSRARVEIVSRKVRSAIRAVQSAQVEIVQSALDKDETRSAMISWFDRVLLEGAESRKHFPDQSKLCSSGFAINLVACLLELNAKHLTGAKETSKNLNFDPVRAHKPSFFPGGPLLSEDGTFQAQGCTDATQWWREEELSQSLFLFGLRALHCFLAPLCGRHEMLAQQILRSHSLPMFDPVHNRWMESEMHANLAQKFAVDAHLCDPHFIKFVVLFCVFVGHKLLEQARSGFSCFCNRTAFDYSFGAENDAESCCLCLPKEVPDSFQGLPQYLLGDICEILLWVCKFAPRTMQILGFGPSIVAFAGSFLSSPGYVRSVHLRARLGDMLFELFGRRRDVNKMGMSILPLENLAVPGLADRLVALYVDASRTGVSSTELHRYKIARLVQRCWKTHLKGKDSKVTVNDLQKSLYRSFAHAVLNEYCLMHDTWVQLEELRDLRRSLAAMVSGGDQNSIMQALNETHIAALEDRTYDCFRLASEMVKMMCYWSVVIPEVFMEECFVQRVADVLNSTLSTLLKLKPDDTLDKKATKEAISKTRRSLKDVLKTYLNFAVACPMFSRAVVDSGLYEKEMFVKALEALKSNKRLEDTDKLYSCVKRFSLSLAETETANAALDNTTNVPEEFLDPVLQVVMTEPVLLPSNNIIDRKTILQHLLNAPNDPFTREPLSLEDCKPVPELQKRIQDFLDSRKGVCSESEKR